MVQPMTTSTAESENITGHSLKGKKCTLNPVSKDMNAIMIRHIEVKRYMTVDAVPVGSRAVMVMTVRPRKIRVTPSIIHSIEIIRWLSSEMSPNPRTTDLVGIRCAIPQSKDKPPPIYIRLCPFIVSHTERWS
jgi:hypothetical protein